MTGRIYVLWVGTWGGGFGGRGIGRNMSLLFAIKYHYKFPTIIVVVSLLIYNPPFVLKAVWIKNFQEYISWLNISSHFNY